MAEIGDMPSRSCPRCGQRVPRRGGPPARFCPVCGQRLASLHEAVQAALATEQGTPPIAVWSLILSFFSFIPAIGVIIGLIAIGLGFEAQGRVKDSGGRLRGRGLAIAGALISFVSICLQISCLGRWL